MRGFWAFVAVLTFVSGAQVFAYETISDWRHASVTSAEGVTIRLDYQVLYVNNSSNKPYEYYYLRPVIFNVAARAFNGREQIRVIFNNNAKNLGQCGQRAYPWQESALVDLARAPEGHFYGNMTQNGRRRQTFGQQYADPVGNFALVLNPYCQTEVSTGQEISVVVNGRWLVDPVSMSTTFRLNLEPALVARYDR